MIAKKPLIEKYQSSDGPHTPSSSDRQILL